MYCDFDEAKYYRRFIVMIMFIIYVFMIMIPKWLKVMLHHEVSDENVY